MNKFPAINAILGCPLFQSLFTAEHDDYIKEKNHSMTDFKAADYYALSQASDRDIAIVTFKTSYNCVHFSFVRIVVLSNCVIF